MSASHIQAKVKHSMCRLPGEECTFHNKITASCQRALQHYVLHSTTLSCPKIVRPHSNPLVLDVALQINLTQALFHATASSYCCCLRPLVSKEHKECRCQVLDSRMYAHVIQAVATLKRAYSHSHKSFHCKSSKLEQIIGKSYWARDSVLSGM